MRHSVDYNFLQQPQQEKKKSQFFLAWCRLSDYRKIELDEMETQIYCGMKSIPNMSTKHPIAWN